MIGGRATLYQGVSRGSVLAGLLLCGLCVQASIPLEKIYQYPQICFYPLPKADCSQENQDTGSGPRLQLLLAGEAMSALADAWTCGHFSTPQDLAEGGRPDVSNLSGQRKKMGQGGS